MTKTTINRTWLLKMSVFTVGLALLGVWGLYDAAIRYPNRGRLAAEWAQLEYLTKARDAGQLTTAGVTDPVSELAQLRADEEKTQQELADAKAANRTALVNDLDMKLLRLEWLTSLKRVGALESAASSLTAPRQRLTELDAKWSAKNPPKPLSTFDIPSQWLITAAGFGASLYLLFLMFKVSRRVYTFDEESLTLTLPDGRAVTPDDIDEVDKRKWDKYFVQLRLKEGGATIKLDLLRFTNLEDWVLEMEKHTEGYEPPEDEDEGENEGASDPDAEAEQTADAKGEVSGDQLGADNTSSHGAPSGGA